MFIRTVCTIGMAVLVFVITTSNDAVFVLKGIAAMMHFGCILIANEIVVKK